MGKPISVEAFGIIFSLKSANPADREKIDAFYQAAGFEKC